ncbi:sigma-54 interaction domain-containing protein [Parasphingorhabdus sp.]|uniref:sigma-54 interaction domain-containing protein n=1 Tax=Parasphingorhabdus sp. TaxID=2709688 RepID=UPI003001E20F
MTNGNLETQLAEKLIGSSPKMQQLRRIIKFAGQCNSSIMITGPSGSGKEVVAEAIHMASDRGHGAHVAVNCGALPDQLVESELFGHEKGSFTGAVNRHVGLFEQADKGTIFLDEIGDMPINMQVKLLRVLETRLVQRVGGNRPIPVDVRVIAATHKSLGECIRNKLFREDLYYRLCVVPIEVPALHERTEDIPELVAHFLKKQDSRNPLPVFTAEAFAAMQNYGWPGNVRELRNVVERAMVFFSGMDVTAADISMLVQSDIAPVAEPLAGQAFGETIAFAATPVSENPPFATSRQGNGQDNVVRDLNAHLQLEERRIILTALEASHGIVSRAARSINIKRTTLIDKMRKHNIDWDMDEGAICQIAA